MAARARSDASCEGMNGNNGYRLLSRRAYRMESEAEFASFETAGLLPREILDPRIADSVWRVFMPGEYDAAPCLRR